MNKNGLLLGVGGLLAGIAIGFYGANYLNRNTDTAASQKVETRAGDASQAATSGGQIPDVQRILDAAKSNPNDFDAQIGAGNMFAEIQRFKEAFEYYEKAEKLKPEKFEANQKLGNAYFAAKQYTKAASFYAEALRLNPRDPGVRTDYGLTFYLREPNDTGRAIEEYRKSLEIDPKHEITLQNLAVALNEKGLKEELGKVIVRLREINPENPVIKKYGNEK